MYRRRLGKFLKISNDYNNLIKVYLIIYLLYDIPYLKLIRKKTVYDIILLPIVLYVTYITHKSYSKHT